MAELEILLGKTVVLVAHPDDEAAGCGVLLQRMQEPIVVFATDGAPADSFFWGKHGSRDAYARLRRDEARRALKLAGVSQVEFLGEPDHSIRDQTLFTSLDLAIQELERIIERNQPQALLTLAYEGGHPDHDSCNFLTSLLARHFGLPAWDFPLYHRTTDGLIVHQHPLPSGSSQADDSEVVLQPTPSELEIKRRMLQTYVSQGDLKEFAAVIERFRPLPVYDYSRPPHDGVLNYEAWGWPIRGTQVSHAFVEFMKSNSEMPAGSRI